MAGNFTQLYFHAVMAVKFRQAVIHPSWETELFKVVTSALRDLNHTPITINGTYDHIHLLWQHHPTQSISHTMKIAKGRSSHFINSRWEPEERFRWQPGYSIFSVSTDRVPVVKRYIARQKLHHQHKSLQTEQRALLAAANVEGTEADVYLFDLLATE